jgi:Kef-type K+ transport system membrane component KefB
MVGDVLGVLIHIRDAFNSHVVFSMGILLLAGYLIGKLAERVRLPPITGYLVAGLFLGESLTGIIHAHMAQSLQTVTEVALGIVAITIGGEFALDKLRRVGKGILIITIFQLLITFGVVSAFLVIFRLPLIYSLLLGAIASATAPAATVAIVQSLRVRGEFIDYLYGVVALDDAGCVLLFAVILAFAGSLLGGAAAQSAWVVVGHALREVLLSALLGLVGGIAMHLVTIRKFKVNEILIISLGMIFLVTAMSISLDLSPLIADMVMGAIIINMSRKNYRIFRIIEPITPPLYASFFAIAGTELQVGLLANTAILTLGAVYVISRLLGKYAGVYLGAMAARSTEKVRRFLGLCMFPQAGVAIGLVLFLEASPVLSVTSTDTQLQMARIANIVLFSVFINELIGPPLSKLAIARGVEI